MRVTQDNADFKVTFETKKFKSAVQSARKFLGGKPGPVLIELVESKKKPIIRIRQTSPTAIAVITMRDGFTVGKGRKFESVVPDEWLASFTNNISGDETKLLKQGSELTLQAGKRHLTTKEIDVPGDMTLAGDEATLTQAINMTRFLKAAKKIINLKAHFTDRPCAATYGETEKHAFFMVNDQYHGVAVSVRARHEADILLTTNAAAFKPILDADDDTVHGCTIEDGRLVIKSADAKYWMPVFDTAASPSKEDILHNIKIKPNKEIVLDLEELTKAANMMAMGDDASQVFNLKYENKTLNIEYNAATSSAGAEIKAQSEVKRWDDTVSIDPNLFADTLNRFESDKICLWTAGNVLFLQEMETEMPKTGFIIMMVADA